MVWNHFHIHGVELLLRRVAGKLCLFLFVCVCVCVCVSPSCHMIRVVVIIHVALINSHTQFTHALFSGGSVYYTSSLCCSDCGETRVTK